MPARATTSGELNALLANVKLPETLPAEAGVNPMVKVDEPPGATDSGKVRPVKLYPAPAREAWVTLRFAVPGLLMVSD